MLDNIKDSIKAKLYDFAYTPFMSSYVISWVLLNHKYLLIYFGDSVLKEKLACLEKCDIEFLDPLYIALSYVFIYPLFALLFYAITLWYKKRSKDIKVYIEKLIAIPTEEAAKINMDISRLEDDRDSAVKKLREKEDEYNKKLGNLESDIVRTKIEKSNAEKQAEQITTEKGQIENQLIQANGFLASKNDEYAELEKKVVELEKQLTSVAYKELPFTVVNDHAERYQILEYLHGPYDTTYEATILDTMYKEYKIPKAVTRNIHNELISQEILSRDSTNQMQITPTGGLKLVEMMKGIQL